MFSLQIQGVDNDLRMLLNRNNFIRTVCCVCDGLYSRTDMVESLSYDDLPFEQMEFHLRAPDNLA